MALSNKELRERAAKLERTVHWITRNPHGEGNVTGCGKEFVFPMTGNGWRVRDITCEDCDRLICDHLHGNRESVLELATLKSQEKR